MQIKVFIRAGGGVGARKGHRLLLPSAPWHIPMREGMLPARRASARLRHKQNLVIDRVREGRQGKEFSAERATGIKKSFPLLTWAGLHLLSVRAAFNFNSLSFCPVSHPHLYKSWLDSLLGNFLASIKNNMLKFCFSPFPEITLCFWVCLSYYF